MKSRASYTEIGNKKDYISCCDLKFHAIRWSSDNYRYATVVWWSPYSVKLKVTTRNVVFLIAYLCNNNNNNSLFHPFSLIQYGFLQRCAGSVLIITFITIGEDLMARWIIVHVALVIPVQIPRSTATAMHILQQRPMMKATSQTRCIFRCRKSSS